MPTFMYMSLMSCICHTHRYAPDAPVAALTAVARAFSALGAQFASGKLGYPYSTREAVSVARHFQAFPQDGMVRFCYYY